MKAQGRPAAAKAIACHAAELQAGRGLHHATSAATNNEGKKKKASLTEGPAAFLLTTSTGRTAPGAETESSSDHLRGALQCPGQAAHGRKAEPWERKRGFLFPVREGNRRCY